MPLGTPSQRFRARVPGGGGARRSNGYLLVSGKGPGQAAGGRLYAEEGGGEDQNDGAEHGGCGPGVVGGPLVDAEDGEARLVADVEDQVVSVME